MIKSSVAATAALFLACVFVGGCTSPDEAPMRQAQNERGSAGVLPTQPNITLTSDQVRGCAKKVKFPADKREILEKCEGQLSELAQSQLNDVLAPGVYDDIDDVALVINYSGAYRPGWTVGKR